MYTSVLCNCRITKLASVPNNKNYYKLTGNCTCAYLYAEFIITWIMHSQKVSKIGFVVDLEWECRWIEGSGIKLIFSIQFFFVTAFNLYYDWRTGSKRKEVAVSIIN